MQGPRRRPANPSGTWPDAGDGVDQPRWALEARWGSGTPTSALNVPACCWEWASMTRGKSQRVFLPRGARGPDWTDRRGVCGWRGRALSPGQDRRLPGTGWLVRRGPRQRVDVRVHCSRTPSPPDMTRLTGGLGPCVSRPRRRDGARRTAASQVTGPQDRTRALTHLGRLPLLSLTRQGDSPSPCAKDEREGRVRGRHAVCTGGGG